MHNAKVWHATCLVLPGSGAGHPAAPLPGEDARAGGRRAPPPGAPPLAGRLRLPRRARLRCVRVPSAAHPRWRAPADVPPPRAYAPLYACLGALPHAHQPGAAGERVPHLRHAAGGERPLWVLALRGCWAAVGGSWVLGGGWLAGAGHAGAGHASPAHVNGPCAIPLAPAGARHGAAAGARRPQARHLQAAAQARRGQGCWLAAAGVVHGCMRFESRCNSPCSPCLTSSSPTASLALPLHRPAG